MYSYIHTHVYWHDARLPPSAGVRVSFDAVPRCLHTWSRRCPGDGPGDHAGGGAGGSRGPVLPPPGAVCEAPPSPSPGRQVPWAVWLEHKRCLSSHARHELVESCDSPDAFLDIPSSYSASGKEEKITGSTSVCVGGGRERTTDNGFVEGTLILGFNYCFSVASTGLNCCPRTLLVALVRCF